MKKLTVILLSLGLIATTFSGCAKADDPYAGYKKEMNNFFEAVTKINDEMNALDPEDDQAVEQLFAYLEELEEQFKYFSEIEVPDEFKVTEELADGAYDYMVEANGYFKDSFSENSFNEYTLEAAMECYQRANKRMQYVIDIIHGQLPEDESITYE